jgi:hypothetical protein
MPTTQPPDLPPLTGMSPAAAQTLGDYLRRLRTWAYQEVDRAIKKDEAAPQVILSASDQKNPTAIFSLTVDHTGATHVTQIPLGGGKP